MVAETKSEGSLRQPTNSRAEAIIVAEQRAEGSKHEVVDTFGTA